MIKNGDVFGIYTVIQCDNKRTNDGHMIYTLQCNVCHRIYHKSVNHFAYGNCAMCCKHATINTKAIRDKRIRSIFKGMYRRCYKQNDKDYRTYGAKGIYICNEWLENPESFEKWALYNGYDKMLSIDRIESTGPYAPWNCRWITINDNSKFKSSTNIFEIDGIVDSGKGWSRRLDMSINAINKINKKYGNAFTKRYIHNTKHGFKTMIPKDPNLFHL